MLTYNVAGLLRSTPGTARIYPVVGETMDIAEDVHLASPIDGRVRLARTGRSILATAELSTSLEEHCSRCLRPMISAVSVSVEEEALPSIDLDSGLPVDTTAEPDALRIDEHHELDLAGPVTDAISMAEPIAPLCRPDCRGLCPICGADLNEAPGHAHPDEIGDPRLSALADWRPPDTDDTHP